MAFRIVSGQDRADRKRQIGFRVGKLRVLNRPADHLAAPSCRSPGKSWFCHRQLQALLAAPIRRGQDRQSQHHTLRLPRSWNCLCSRPCGRWPRGRLIGGPLWIHHQIRIRQAPAQRQENRLPRARPDQRSVPRLVRKLDPRAVKAERCHR